MTTLPTGTTRVTRAQRFALIDARHAAERAGDWERARELYRAWQIEGFAHCYTDEEVEWAVSILHSFDTTPRP